MSPLGCRPLVYIAAALLVTALAGCANTHASALPDAAIDSSVFDASTPHDAPATDASRPPDEPRLLVVGHDGHIASLQLTAPWTVRARAALGMPSTSARCEAGRCAIVHPEVGAVSVVRAIDLAPVRTLRDVEPRDVAWLDAHTLVVSQPARQALLVLDLDSGGQSTIDLSPLADADGPPVAERLARCEQRLYVQISRAAAERRGTLAVIDLGARALEDVDPATAGVQGIELAQRAGFDMPVDCAAGRLYVAEPRPLMAGGSIYEQVDLATLRASAWREVGAQGGGFEVVTEGEWMITHTEFGPGPSSHLTFSGADFETHNTFAEAHVDDLALDHVAGVLFYPDPCGTLPAHPGCDDGVHVFDAHTGERLSEGAIDVGFSPFEVAIAR